MELRELGYFVAVFEERSVSAAARRCFVSQPSVSEGLAHLESSLDTKLFLRHRKGATPTAQGELLYPIAGKLLRDARAVEKLFHPEPAKRRLRLGLMRSLDIERTKSLVAAVTRDDRFDLSLVDADDECDARIVSHTMVAKEEVFVRLWDERYVVALPRSHPLAGKKSVRAAELAGSRLVERCHCEYGALFAGGGGVLDPVAVAPTEEWALALVAAGVGIAFVPEGVVSRSADVAIVTLRDVHAKRRVGIAYLGGKRSPAPDVQRLVDALTARRT